MSNNHSRAWVLGLVAILMLLPGACADPQAQEKAAIRQLMRDYNTAGQERNGEWCVSMMSPDTLAHYTDLVKLALDGTEAQVRKRTAFDRHEVLLARTLATRKDLRGKDGRAYQVWAVGQGWYVTDEDLYDEWTDGLADISIDSAGTAAWCYIREGRQKTRFTLRFVKVNGKWLFDEPSIYEYFDHWTANEARAMGVSQDQLLADLIEYQHGKEVDFKSVWKPMK